VFTFLLSAGNKMKGFWGEKRTLFLDAAEAAKVHEGLRETAGLIDWNKLPESFQKNPYFSIVRAVEISKRGNEKAAEAVAIIQKEFSDRNIYNTALDALNKDTGFQNMLKTGSPYSDKLQSTVAYFNGKTSIAPSPTGRFGHAERLATAFFQYKAKITVDGAFGLQTEAALMGKELSRKELDALKKDIGAAAPGRPGSPAAKPKDPSGAPPHVPDHPDMEESQRVVSPESRRTDSIFDEVSRKKNPDGSINAAHASTDPITWQVTKEYMGTDLGTKIIRDLEEKAGMQEAIKTRVFEYALDRMEEVGIETGSPTSDYIIYATFKYNESLNGILKKLAPSKKLNRALKNSLETAISNDKAHPNFSHTQDFHRDIILARRSDTKRREMELQNSEETLFARETHVNVPLTATYYWRAHNLAKGTANPMPYPNQWVDGSGNVSADVRRRIGAILQPADGFDKSDIKLKDADYKQLAGYMMSHLLAEEKNQAALFRFEDGKYDQNFIDQTYTALSDMLSNASLDEPGNVVALGVLALAGYKIFSSNSNWANAAKFGAVALAARHVYMEHTGEDPLEQFGLFTRESAYAGTKFQAELDYFDDLVKAELIDPSDLEKRALDETGIRGRVMGQMNDLPMARLNQWYEDYARIFNAKGSVTKAEFVKDMPKELKGIIESKEDYEIAQIGLGLMGLFYKRVSHRRLQVSGAAGVPTPDDGMRSVQEYMEEHSKLYKKTEDTITFGEVITFYQDSETLLEGTNRSRTIPGSAMAVAGDLAGKAVDYGKDAARKIGKIPDEIEKVWPADMKKFVSDTIAAGGTVVKNGTNYVVTKFNSLSFAPKINAVFSTGGELLSLGFDTFMIPIKFLYDMAKGVAGWNQSTGIAGLLEWATANASELVKWAQDLDPYEARQNTLADFLDHDDAFTNETLGHFADDFKTVNGARNKTDQRALPSEEGGNAIFSIAEFDMSTQGPDFQKKSFNEKMSIMREKLLQQAQTKIENWKTANTGVTNSAFDPTKDIVKYVYVPAEQTMRLFVRMPVIRNPMTPQKAEEVKTLEYLVVGEYERWINANPPRKAELEKKFFDNPTRVWKAWHWATLGATNLFIDPQINGYHAMRLRVLKWFKDKASPNGKRKMADGTITNTNFDDAFSRLYKKRDNWSKEDLTP
jgi:hypothetical protein